MTAPLTVPPRIATGDVPALGGRRLAGGDDRRRGAADPAGGADLLGRHPAHRLRAEAARGVAGGTRVSTFVLVHGAWHGAWCWERVTPRLTDAGHDVITPTLTGLGERAGEASADVNLDTHIADLVAALDGLPDAVVVAHSYAGFAAYGAAERTGDRPARAARRLHPARRRDDGRPRRRARRPVPRGGGRRPGLARPGAAGGCARRRRGGRRVGRLEHDAAAGPDLPAADRADRRRREARPLLHRLHVAVAGDARREQAPDGRAGADRPSSPAGTTR